MPIAWQLLIIKSSFYFEKEPCGFMNALNFLDCFHICYSVDLTFYKFHRRKTEKRAEPGFSDELARGRPSPYLEAILLDRTKVTLPKVQLIHQSTYLSK